MREAATKSKATRLAKLAEACAGAGIFENGLEIALDIEQLVNEANTLLDAASMVHRIGKT